MRNNVRRLPVILLTIILPAAGMASAQTSKAILQKEAGEYVALKRTFQKMFDEGEIEVSILRDQGAVDLMDCSYGQTYLGSETGGHVSGRTRQRADLAYEVVRLKKLMTELGYPESVWRPVLLVIEENGQSEFDPVGGQHLEKLSE